MKALYKKVLAKFADELPKFIWVDKDKGQLNTYDTKPAIGYPACLIAMNISNARDRGDGSQMCDMQIVFRLAWDFTGETNAGTLEANLNQSLAYYDDLDDVFEAFQEWEDEEGTFNPWDRTSQIEEPRPDQLQVTEMIFETTYIEKRVSS